MVAALGAVTTCPAAARPRAVTATPPFVVVARSAAGASSGYFKLDSAAGAASDAGALLLRNTSRRTVRLLLVPVDALTATNLGSTYKELGTPRHGPALWIHLARRKLTLAPGASAAVAVRVAVPHGTAAGDYLAGVSIQTRRRKPRLQHLRSNIEIAAVVRYAVGVEVRIPGPRHPAITLSRVVLERQPRGLAFLVYANNTGNVILKDVTGTIRVTRGRTRVVETSIGPGTFVTATSIQIAALALTQEVQEGTVFHVHADLSYAGGRVRLDRDVRFGAKEALLQQQFGGRHVAAAHGWPWLAIVIAVLVASAVLALLLGGNRRRRERALPPALVVLERALLDPRRAGSPVSVLMIDGDSDDDWRSAVTALTRRRLRPTDSLALGARGALVTIAPDTGALTAAGLADDLRATLARELPALRGRLRVGTATAGDDDFDAAGLLAAAERERQPID